MATNEIGYEGYYIADTQSFQFDINIPMLRLEKPENDWLIKSGIFMA